MNGFRYGIIGILRNNNMPINVARGLFIGTLVSEDSKDTFIYLRDLGCLVESVPIKNVIFDYVAIPQEAISLRNFLKAISVTDHRGIVILDITGKEHKFSEEYKHVGSGYGYSGTRVRYYDKTFLVFKLGYDYGN